MASHRTDNAAKARIRNAPFPPIDHLPYPYSPRARKKKKNTIRASSIFNLLVVRSYPPRRPPSVEASIPRCAFSVTLLLLGPALSAISILSPLITSLVIFLLHPRSHPFDEPPQPKFFLHRPLAISDNSNHLHHGSSLILRLRVSCITLLHPSP